jgi:hypothetical protein
MSRWAKLFAVLAAMSVLFTGLFQVAPASAEGVLQHGLPDLSPSDADGMATSA